MDFRSLKKKLTLRLYQKVFNKAYLTFKSTTTRAKVTCRQASKVATIYQKYFYNKYVEIYTSNGTDTDNDSVDLAL